MARQLLSRLGLNVREQVSRGRSNHQPSRLAAEQTPEIESAPDRALGIEDDVKRPDRRTRLEQVGDPADNPAVIKHRIKQPLNHGGERPGIDRMAARDPDYMGIRKGTAQRPDEGQLP